MLKPDRFKIHVRGWRGYLLAFILGILSILIGLILSKISRLVFPLVMTLMIYPLYYLDLKEGRNWDAAYHVLMWALSSSLTLILITMSLGEEIGELILKGNSYKQEMFRWIRTGAGPEGDPSLFMIPKLTELGLFSILCFVSAGFLGLFLGSFLLNYMNYYVGCLFIHSKAGMMWAPILLGWPIYAILRVIGYVNLGVVLSIPFFSRLLGASFDGKQVKKQLYLALAMITLDFLLKGTLANLVYQPILKRAIELG